jgi:hypothetical protein
MHLHSTQPFPNLFSFRLRSGSERNDQLLPHTFHRPEPMHLQSIKMGLPPLGWENFQQLVNLVGAADILPSLTIYLLIALLCRERPHDSELSGDNLHAAPYEIDHKTCFGPRFLDGTSDANFPKAKRQSPLMTQPVISPASILRRSRQNITSRRRPEMPKKSLSELLGLVPETTVHAVCSEMNSSSKAGIFPEEIAEQRMSEISPRSTILRSF